MTSRQPPVLLATVILKSYGQEIGEEMEALWERAYHRNQYKNS